MHPEKQPISLQYHGIPVRFRNIWLRELGPIGKKEFTLPDALLDEYVDSYFSSNNPVEIIRVESQLVAELANVRFVLFAESPTRFFTKTTDVQFEFFPDGQGKVERLVWSIGEGCDYRNQE